MTLQQDPSGRLHIESSLMAESLMDRALLERTEIASVFRPLPDLNVVKLGHERRVDAVG